MSHNKCPLCEAGIPLAKRFLVPVFEEGKRKFLTLSSETYQKILDLLPAVDELTEEEVVDKPTKEKNEYVCADCGNEQATMISCEKCRSRRVILISVASDLFGSDWRDAFR